MVFAWLAVHPRLTLAWWAGLTLLALSGIAKLDFELTTESVLDVSAPAWARYESSVRDFGSDEVVVLAWPAHEAERSAAAVASYAETLPNVRRVDSLQTLPLARSTNGDLDLRSPMAAAEASGLGLRGALDIASRDPFARGVVASRDGTVVAVNVVLDPGDPHSQAKAVEALRSAAPTAWISGVPVFKVEASRRTRSELSLFVPVTVAVVGAMLAVACGARVAFSVVLVALAGSAAGLGAMGQAQVPLTISTMILPSILFVLGTAYSLHVVHACCATPDGPEPARAALVAAPVVMSALTTALGFGSLCVVEIPVVRQLGVFGAIGVGVQALASLTLLPGVLGIMSARSGEGGVRVFSRFSRWLARFVLSRRGVIVAAWGIAVTVAITFVPELTVETDAVKWFPRGSRVRDAYEEIRSALAGISPVNVVIEAAAGGQDVASPAVFRQLQELTEFLEALPEVGKALSIAGPVHALHEQLLGAGQPISSDMLHQYLLLVESLPYSKDLIKPDLSAVNVILRVDDNSSRSLLEISNEAVNWWKDHGDPRYNASATGVMYEFARAEEAIAWGQIKGLSLALVAVASVLLVLFRDWKMCAAAMLPNAIPLVLAFGLMGGLGVPLDAVTIGIGCLVLGIAVDDTLHVAVWFRRGRDEGLSPARAIRHALRHALRPMVLTTAAVSVGFGALLLSGFAVTQSLGGVTSFMMIVCLAADTTMLPVLLVSADRESGN